MATNGEKLKAARLKQGKSLQDIAELTRISPAFLEALEENQLDRIPGIFFRRSFLKQYASTLGLNPDEFQLDEAMEFRSLGGEEPGTVSGVRLHEPPDLPPLPPSGGRRSVPFRQIFLSIGLLIGVLALCAVAYTLWEDYQLGRDPDQALLEDPIAPPFPAAEPLAGQATEPAQAESSSPHQPDPSASSQESMEATNATPSATPASQPTPAPATTPQPAEVEAAPRTTFGEGSRELRLSASAPAWVQVQEGEKTVYTGVIQPGQNRVIRVTDGARLVVGNAGGLNLAWQGKTMEPVGPLGQVRIVNVTLDGVTVAAPQKREQGDQQDDT